MIVVRRNDCGRTFSLTSSPGDDGLQVLARHHQPVGSALGLRPKQQSKLERLEAALDGAAGERDLVRSAWATALAIAWLRTHAPAFEGQWQLLAAKGRRWLDEVAAVPPRGTAWLEAAERFLATNR